MSKLTEFQRWIVSETKDFLTASNLHFGKVHLSLFLGLYAESFPLVLGIISDKYLGTQLLCILCIVIIEKGISPHKNTKVSIRGFIFHI